MSSVNNALSNIQIRGEKYAHEYCRWTSHMSLTTMVEDVETMITRKATSMKERVF